MPDELIAMTRAVPPSIGQCELTHLERQPIDVALAREQHASYEEALAVLGCRVVRIEPAPDMPDSVFVEDIAVVLDELAIITRPGAVSRRRETPAVAAALSGLRDLRFIHEPGTLDGGDVLVIGRQIFVGLSTRTNGEATLQLRGIVEPCGYQVHEVPVRGALHLKSAVTAVGDEAVLLDPRSVDARTFARFDIIETHPEETGAGNVLRIGSSILGSAAASRTLETIRGRGFEILAIDQSELARAEAGLTCCSLVFRA